MENNENEALDLYLKNRSMAQIYLLFDEKFEMPSENQICDQFKKLGYSIEPKRFGEDENSIQLFYFNDYTIDFDDAKNVPYQLSMFNLGLTDKPHGTELARTQFWNTPNGSELLDTCLWQVLIGDFMSQSQPPKVRAQLLSDYLDICLQLFPTCKGVWFEGSQNVMSVSDLKDNPYQGINKIFYGALNARFFRVGTTEEFVVDTLGMHIFGLPDVQIHFRDLNPDDVVKLAYDIAFYQFENDVPISDGQTVRGFHLNGDLDNDIKWKCFYEFSMIEPKRDVLDINTGKFAAGNRD